MSATIKKSLFIALLIFVAFMGAAYYLHMTYARQEKDLRTRRDSLKEELESLNLVIADYDFAVDKLNSLEERRNNKNQIVPANDNPAHTLAYLNKIRKAVGRNIQFDLLYQGEEEQETFSTNKYVIEGKGRFRDLRAFIHHIEKGPLFYQIVYLNAEFVESVAGVYTSGWDWVDFKVGLMAYFTPQAPAVAKMPPYGYEVRGLSAYNPFRPLITKGLPKNSADLLVVEGARLKVLTHDMAHVVDGGGKLYKLKEGDAVYLGKLVKIDIYRNRVDFVLNEGGIRKEPHLTLQAEVEESGVQ